MEQKNVNVDQVAPVLNVPVLQDAQEIVDQKIAASLSLNFVLSLKPEF